MVRCGTVGIASVELHLAVRAEWFSCRPLAAAGVDFQADGEWVGRIPMEVSLVKGALRLLVPE